MLNPAIIRVAWYRLKAGASPKRFSNRLPRYVFCIVPVAGGLVGSTLYYVDLYRLGATSGGAGSSIISAAMTGEMIVISAITLSDTSRRKEILPLIVSVAFVLVLLFVFRGDYMLAGNETAHVYGLLSGALITFGYFRLAGLTIHDSSEPLRLKWKLSQGKNVTRQRIFPCEAHCALLVSVSTFPRPSFSEGISLT